MGHFNLFPFIISRSCEILAFLFCSIVLMFYCTGIRQEKSRHNSVAFSIQLNFYGVVLIVMIQNLFNAVTSWIFVLDSSIKNNSDHTTICAFKQYTNFVLTAIFKFSLYSFFIIRMRMALAESALRYPAYIIYIVRTSIACYCIIFIYLGFTKAHIVTFESYNNGFDCYYEFKNLILWSVGITDTVLSALCSFLFVYKLFMLHKLRETWNEDSMHVSYIYDPHISISQSTKYQLSSSNEETMRDSMGKLKHSIHSALTAHDRYKYSKSLSNVHENKMQLLPRKITLLWFIAIVSTWLLYYLGYTVLPWLGWFVPVNGIIDVLCVYLCFKFHDKLLYQKCIPCIEQCWVCAIQCCCRFCCCCCLRCCYKTIQLDGSLKLLNQSDHENIKLNP
eukprot:290939_1